MVKVSYLLLILFEMLLLELFKSSVKFLKMCLWILRMIMIRYHGGKMASILDVLIYDYLNMNNERNNVIVVLLYY